MCWSRVDISPGGGYEPPPAGRSGAAGAANQSRFGTTFGADGSKT
jgi:hypothetical protein